MADPSSNLRTVINPDGAAILDIQGNQITTLNSTGGFIWERLQQGTPVEQIVRALACESNTDPLIVEKDVNTFLKQLQSKHLIRS